MSGQKICHATPCRKCGGQCVLSEDPNETVDGHKYQFWCESCGHGRIVVHAGLARGKAKILTPR